MPSDTTPIIDPRLKTSMPKAKLLSTSEIIAKYGEPGPDNLVVIPLPYPMRISWDLTHRISKMQCHKLCAGAFKAVFTDLLSVYGLAKLQELGIDLYGGCYNFRQMRGGTEWSRHSWGIAIDLDPARNTLHETHQTARFARPEYEQMIQIFYSNGFVGLGREKDYDWMHFQIGS
jgi:hypothetical protein